MEKQHREHHNGGFIIGVIVGAILTLLFTTRKGRRLLQHVSHEGLEKFGEWEGLVKDITDALDDDSREGDDYTVRYEKRNESEHSNNSYDSSEAPETDNPVTHAKSSSKRFFRGVRKKS